MAIITITSDYGNKDYFKAAVKGALYSEIPNAQIVDISHDISAFNIQEAAYILKNAYHHFPPGTIHLIGVDTEATKSKVHIICMYENHFFIGADSGIFSLMFPDIKAEQIIELNITQESDNKLFPMKDVFVKAASHINRGGTIGVIGRRLEQIKEVKGFQPTQSTDRKTINGQVIYIDHYGNVITNITEKFFKQCYISNSFKINLPRKYSISKLHTSYSEVPETTIIALFNSARHLEIAINKCDSNSSNGASGLLGIKIKDRISIEFT